MVKKWRRNMFSRALTFSTNLILTFDPISLSHLYLCMVEKEKKLPLKNSVEKCSDDQKRKAKRFTFFSLFT